GGTGCGSLTCCSSGCINQLTDNNNCGSCGNNCTAQGKTCLSGVCNSPSCNYDAWVNQGCGINNCPIGQMYQNRTILSGADCTNLSQCVTNDSCSLIQGAVSYWKFDNDYGTVLVDALGRNNGTIYNGVSWTSSGKSGGAYNFDGVNDYMSFRRIIQDDFTIAAWVKTSSSDSCSGSWYQGKGIVDGEVNTVINDFGLVMCRGKLAFGTGSPDNTLTSSQSINSGQWTFVASTRVKSTGLKTIYLNGVSVGTSGASTSSLTAPSNLTIGNVIVGTGNNFWNGAIDEVIIFNRSLSEAEINRLYSGY
ncbi:MAG: LamG domain-containing protein, partial [Candidatus Pacearchaeota archaeon]